MSGKEENFFLAVVVRGKQFEGAEADIVQKIEESHPRITGPDLETEAYANFERGAAVVCFQGSQQECSDLVARLTQCTAESYGFILLQTKLARRGEWTFVLAY